MPFGQAKSAIARGKAFERMVKADGYAILLGLLREQFKLGTSQARVENLHARFPHDPKDPQGPLSARANATREIVGRFLSGDHDAPNLVDGAVLAIQLGGYTGYLETDALALRFAGLIRVGEIKSFPVVDGHADPEKVGGAADQSAVYVMALEDLVSALGGNPDETVSTEILLVTPLNTGMRPVLHDVDVSRRVAHHRRQLAGAPDLGELISRIPQGITFPGAGSTDPGSALKVLAEQTGTFYVPSCLTFCGAARWCRARSQRVGDPACIGSTAKRHLPGIESLDRADQIARGAVPGSEESAAAEIIQGAARLIERADPPRGNKDTRTAA